MNRHAKKLQKKAKKVTILNKVATQSGILWTVKSPSGSEYDIFEHADGSGFSCTCEWAKYHDTRKSACSHVLGLIRAIKAEKGKATSFWFDAEDAKRQHRATFGVGDIIATTRTA